MLNLFNFIFGAVKFCTFNLGGAAAAVGIASGVSNLLGGGDSGGGGGGGGTTAGGTVYDPFAQYRPEFGGQLAAMMRPGATFGTSDPSYNWRFGQGLEAVNRTEAARGMLGSGNRLAELMKYGQGMASTEYGNQFNRLASLAGTSQTMGSSMGSLQAQQQQAGWSAVGQGLGGLNTAVNNPNTMLGQWFGSGTTGGTTDMTGFYTDPWSGGGSSYGSTFDVGGLF